MCPLSHCRCCMFLLPTWQTKMRFSFGAKQQHKVMVPPTQVWTAWWRSCGLTCLAGRGGLSEVEIVLLLRYSGQMWCSEMVWIFLHRKKSAIYTVEERMQTANCLSSCRGFFWFFEPKSVSKAVKYTPIPGFFLEIKVILNIIDWFSHDSFLNLHIHFVTNCIQFCLTFLYAFLQSLTHITKKIKRKGRAFQLFWSLPPKQTFRFMSRSDHYLCWFYFPSCVWTDLS